MQLRIAEIGIELTWDHGLTVRESPDSIYLPFLVNGRQEPVDVRLRLHGGGLPHISPEAMLFDAVHPNGWRLCRVDGRYAFEFFHTKAPHPRVQLAVMAPDFRSGDLYREPEKPSSSQPRSLADLMGAFGELLLVNLLGHGRGVLMHSMGVVDEGRGMLFVGRSGAGKSTMADLYRARGGATILGDEHIVVSRSGDRFYVSGTPWPGSGFKVSPDTAPLRQIFFLEHGPRNMLIPDSVRNLYTLLLQQCFLSFWNDGEMAFALQFAEELLRGVPAARLAFVNDARVIDFLREQT